MTIFSPAKINLHLKVLDKRPDGFHNLESLFLALDFGDILHFEYFTEKKRENTAEIVMNGLDIDIPMEKNIVFEALSLFKRRNMFFWDYRLKVTVEKHIPVGGGLGGGSSNAAAALLALNDLSGFPFSRYALLEMAEALGSDVPFFLYETAAARVTGRGGSVRPVDAPDLFFVLVNPGFSSGTAAAFRLLDAHRDAFPNSAAQASPREIDLEQMAQGAYWNDFLPVFEKSEKSVYDEIISKLRESGALFAGISGAGSTCFGVFKEKDIAQNAADVLRACGKWKFVQYASIYNSHMENYAHIVR